MKVALVNNFPPYSGTGRVAYELFQAFQRLHLSVGRCNLPEVDLYCTHYLHREELSLPENREVKFLHGFPYKGRENLSRFLIYFVDPFRVPRRYDLYHITNHMLGNYLYFLKPAIVTVHDLLQFKYQENRGGTLSSKIYNTLLQISLKALSRAEKIVCVSEWTRREVLRRFSLPDEKVVTVYNGINHEIFHPGDKNAARRELNLPLGQKIVLHVGAETKRKNIPALLQAIAEILKSDDQITLVRIGEKKKETTDLIGRLGLEDKVLHIENVRESKLVRYYQTADVTVLPSYDEGFGFPVLESLACGTPVVCSKIGPLPEIGGEASLYADPTSVADLAEKIFSVLHDDTAQYHRRSLIGLEQARKFSWEKAAEGYFRVYTEVLGGGTQT